MGASKFISWRKVFSWLTRYVLPWAVTALMLVWLFGKVNFRQVMAIIAHGNFWWLGVMMLLTALSLVIRGIRWDMQLMQVGVPRMPVIVDSCAIFGAYALNLLFPRLGEAWRCLYVSRRQGCPFMTVVGTDIGDRTADFLCVVVTVLLALIVAPATMHRFFHRYEVGRIVDAVFSSAWTYIGLTILFAALWAVMHLGARYQWVLHTRRALCRVWTGFIALFKVRPLYYYLFLTLGIWICYFLETYLCFFAFPFTTSLIHSPGLAWGLTPGLICLVFGSCSTIIPSNGGLGPWTIATAFALELYGVSSTDAAAYALAVWGMQAVMLILLGIFTVFYTRRSYHKRATAPVPLSAPEP